jgi:ATP-binding cassette subfamily A (ABC1) protein 5
VSNVFRYEIRTNPSFVVTPSTTELYSSPASCRESEGHWSGVFPIETGESCPVNQYYYSGFVAIQALFDFTKIRVSSNSFTVNLVHRIHRVFQKELHNFESLYTFIQRTHTVLRTVIM